MNKKCKHKGVQKLQLEHYYGFLAEVITSCKDCGKVISSQWYQSDDCGDTWHLCKDPMDNEG